MVVREETGKFTKDLRDIWGLDKIRPHKMTHDEIQEEAGLSVFGSYVPENMLKLVRLAQPQLVSNKIFTEIPMDPVDNSVTYIRPSFGSRKLTTPMQVGNVNNVIKQSHNNWRQSGWNRIIKH
jgi:hypothetical protein